MRLYIFLWATAVKLSFRAANWPEANLQKLLIGPKYSSNVVLIQNNAPKHSVPKIILKSQIVLEINYFYIERKADVVYNMLV